MTCPALCLHPSHSHLWEMSWHPPKSSFTTFQSSSVFIPACWGYLAMLQGGDVPLAVPTWRGGLSPVTPPVRCKVGWSGGSCRPSGCRFSSGAEAEAVKYL